MAHRDTTEGDITVRQRDFDAPAPAMPAMSVVSGSLSCTGVRLSERRRYPSTLSAKQRDSGATWVVVAVHTPPAPAVGRSLRCVATGPSLR